LVLAQRFRAETLLVLERIDEAGQALDRYLAATREPPAEVYQARGLIHAGAGQLPAAIDMYSAALRQNPRDTATRCYRGWTYLLTEAVPLALADFEECLGEKPDYADALAGRGNAQIRLCRFSAAVADAEAAEKQGPVTDRLLYNLTRIYAQAAAQVEAEGRSRRIPLSAERLTFYEEKALQYLGRTMEELPEERRVAFWRDQVQKDPALAGIRRGEGYSRLAQRYSQLDF